MTLLLGGLLLIASVLLGAAIVVFLHQFNQAKIIKVLLALSGGFLLSIAFIHFIPEMYAHNSPHIGYYILLGFLIQLFLEYFSGGIEHGHIHVPDKKGTMPWTLFIALSIHAVFEALPLESQMLPELIDESMNHIGHSHAHQHVAGEYGGRNSYLIGVILHKIPEAVALMTLLLAAEFSKKKVWTVIVVFALMSPLGMLLGHYGSKIILFNTDTVLAVVVGMFLHISTTIIFESSDNHQFNFLKLISILAGVGLAILVM